MKKIKEILEKIKSFLKRLQKKEEFLLISESSSFQENTENRNITIEDRELEKKEFFQIYNNVKKGIISLDELMFDDLIKVLLMMKNEENVLDNEINKRKNEIMQIETNIKILERENESMRIQLNNFT